MRSAVRGLGILGLAAIGALAPSWGPGLLSGIDAFRARDVEVAGLTYLPESEVLSLGGIGPSTSIWTSLGEIEERLREHPLIRAVVVDRELPGRLLITVEERVPVGLVSTPTLQPVDEEGRYLPIDPAKWQLDVPLIEPLVAEGREGAPRPRQLRELARLAAEMRGDAVIWTRVSTIRETERGEIVAEWVDPEVSFRLAPGTALPRLQQGVVALEKELARGEEGRPRAVDLRWSGQVFVCSRIGRSRSECEDI